MEFVICPVFLVTVLTCLVLQWRVEFIFHLQTFYPATGYGGLPLKEPVHATIQMNTAKRVKKFSLPLLEGASSTTRTISIFCSEIMNRNRSGIPWAKHRGICVLSQFDHGNSRVKDAVNIK
jgi:hypothetical protein